MAYEKKRFPIHAAASGANLQLVRWLIDTHKCPIQTFSPQLRTNSNFNSSVITTLDDDMNKSTISHLYDKNHDISNKHGLASQLIKTSNGRTIVDVALEQSDLDLLRYLVDEKKLRLASSQISAQNQDVAFKTLEMFLKNQNTMRSDDINTTNSPPKDQKKSNRLSKYRRDNGCNIACSKNGQGNKTNSTTDDGGCQMFVHEYNEKFDRECNSIFKDDDVWKRNNGSKIRSITTDPTMSQSSSSSGSNRSTKIYSRKERGRSRSRSLIDNRSSNRSRSENSLSSMSSRRRKWTRMKVKKASKKNGRHAHDKENLPKLRDEYNSDKNKMRSSSRVRERDENTVNDTHPLVCNVSFPFFDDECL